MHLETNAPLPWYVAGPLIGLMVPVLLVLGNRSLGISSTLRDLCAICIPSLSTSLKANLKENAWNLFFALGIGIGGFVNGHFFTSTETTAISEKTWNDLSKLGIARSSELIPTEIFSWSHLLDQQGLLFMVAGGLLVGFGTRYAGGCTSGHGILGLATVSKGSLLAVIGFFIGGLLMTHLLFPIIF